MTGTAPWTASRPRRISSVAWQDEAWPSKVTGEDDVRLHLDAFTRLGSSALYDDGLGELLAAARARIV